MCHPKTALSRVRPRSTQRLQDLTLSARRPWRQVTEPGPCLIFYVSKVRCRQWQGVGQLNQGPGAGKQKRTRLYCFSCLAGFGLIVEVSFHITRSPNFIWSESVFSHCDLALQRNCFLIIRINGIRTGRIFGRLATVATIKENSTE